MRWVLWCLPWVSLLAQAPTSTLPLSSNYLAVKRTDGSPIVDFEGSKKLLAGIENVVALPDLRKLGILLISVPDRNAAVKRYDLEKAIRNWTGWTLLPVYEQGRDTYIPRDTMSVRFRRGVNDSRIESLLGALGCRVLRKPVDPAGEWKIAATQPDSAGPGKLVEQLKNDASVEWAGIDYVVLSREPTLIKPLPSPPKD